MAGGVADSVEKQLLDKYFGATDFTPPATFHAALGTDTNTVAQRSAGTVTEVSTGVWTNYARIAVTNNTTNFPNASGTTASKSNGTVINFGTATISGTAPVVTVVYLYTASSGGTPVAHASLTSNQTINNGNAVSIAIGALTWTMNES
jgi:hypothetical protein